MKQIFKMVGSARCADRTPQRGVPTFLIAAVILFFAAFPARPQATPLGHATDFTSESYFEPPHEQQVKLRLSGAEASPLPGGLLDVKQLRVETFNEAGKPEMVVRAPQCTYAPLDGEANSAGRLELQTGDGKFRVEGEGFLWRQNASSLTISNRVRTTIDLPMMNTTAS
jgi:hypothetical protein